MPRILGAILCLVAVLPGESLGVQDQVTLLIHRPDGSSTTTLARPAGPPFGDGVTGTMPGALVFGVSTASCCFFSSISALLSAMTLGEFYCHSFLKDAFCHFIGIDPVFFLDIFPREPFIDLLLSPVAGFTDHEDRKGEGLVVHGGPYDFLAFLEVLFDVSLIHEHRCFSPV